jgi:hypothetical protein
MGDKNKKTDAKILWGQEDPYAVDRCHHILKLLAYGVVVVLLVIIAGFTIATWQLHSPSTTTMNIKSNRPDPRQESKLPPPLAEQPPQPPTDNQLVVKSKDRPTPKPEPKGPACDPLSVWLPGQVKLAGTIPSYVSPDPADGAFNWFTLNLTMTIHLPIGSTFPDPQKLYGQLAPIGWSCPSLDCSSCEPFDSPLSAICFGFCQGYAAWIL